MLWNRCHVTAHFPASTDIPTTLRLAHEIWFRGDSDDDRTTGTLRLLDEYTIQSIPHQDWVVTVQRGWTPIVVSNRFVLRFPWHTDQDVAKAVRASSSSSSTGSKQSHRPLVSLQLQGGIAFGTGEHPTTQLCLEWLDAVITPMLPNESISSSSSSPQSQPPQPPPRPTLTVLDYGSGSGILGLAACALSTPRGTVTAVGFDVDVDACVIANVNAANNDLPMRSYLPPLVAVNDDDDIDDDDIDDVSKSQLFKAHHRIHQRKEDGRDETGNSKTVGGVVLQDLILCDDPEPFDVAVANIMAGPLVALAPTLARRIKPGARLGMSGILPHQGDMVVQAYRAAGFANVHVAKEMGGWLLVTAQKPEN